MAMPQDTNDTPKSRHSGRPMRTRVEQGIRRDRWGWEAYIKLGQRQVAKRFAPETPIDELRLWRARQKLAHRKMMGSNKRISRLFKAHTEPLPRSENGWCYVYFIQDGEVVKIGRALDPYERRRNLQSAHNRPLTLIAAVPAHASLEGAIHRRFAHVREETTEWFRLDEALEAFIEAIKAGQNPVALLW